MGKSMFHGLRTPNRGPHNLTGLSRLKWSAAKMFLGAMEDDCLIKKRLIPEALAHRMRPRRFLVLNGLRANHSS